MYSKDTFTAIHSKAMKRKIIVDNDGGVDDAWAIFTLLTYPDVEIVALTCVFGNTSLDNVCNNNLRLAAQFGRNNIPVYKGSGSPLIQNDSGSALPDGFQYFHGKNGFGDVYLPFLPDTPSLREENAISMLNSIAKDNQGEITLVCLGPLTNIALAVRSYPEFAGNVKDVFIMGGNLTAQGNSTKRPEFNIHVDPEAADVVFRAFGEKVTLLPWEACRTTKISLDWKEEIESVCGPSIEFLKLIERPLTHRKISMGFNSFVSSDVLCSVIFLRPDAILEDAHHSIAVELAGKYTRGQIVVLDHLDDCLKRKAKIVQKVDVQVYMETLKSLMNL